MNKLYIIFAPIFLLSILSCSTEDKNGNYTPIPVSRIYSFAKDYNKMDSTERNQLYRTDSTAINAFMSTVTELPVSDETLAAWSESRVVEIFTPTVDSVFANSDKTSSALTYILGKASESGINLPSRIYAEVVYGRPESILFVDSVMLISLNHYLGEDYPGYSHWPSYIRKNKTPEMLPYDLAEALVGTEYPYTATDNPTVISRLIYEGALAKAKALLVKDSSPASALGYYDSEYKWLLDNETDIWRSMVHNKLIYDTSESNAEKLVAPSPSVNIINPIAPGRAGRFIGYRIVESYLKKHPETTIAEMLHPDFYNSPNILTDSGY